MVRGKKNFLPPVRLEMGYGVLFRVDNTCIANHANERRVRGLDSEESGNEPVAAVTRDADGNPIDPEKRMRKFEKKALKKQQVDDSEEDAPEPQPTQASDAAQPDEAPDEEEDQQAAAGVASDSEDKSDAEEPVADQDLADEEAAGDSESAGAPEEGADVDQDQLDSEETQQQRGSSKLSFKEKRLLKKYKRKGQLPPPPSERPVMDEAVVKRPEATKPSKPPQAPSVRGKKGKLKKMQKKYADQDDEDRKLGMRAMGNKASSDEEESEEEVEEAPAMDAAQSKLAAAAITAAAEEEEGMKRRHLEYKQREREQEEKQSRRAKKDQADKEIRHILEEESILPVPEAGEQDQFDAFTGIPVEEDILRFCLPVCAPYNAMQNYKFKVKIIPGTQKKGKACKQIVDMFTRIPGCASIEKDLLKQMTDAELVSSMMSDIKISTPGMYAAKNNAKKGGKGGKRPAPKKNKGK